MQHELELQLRAQSDNFGGLDHAHNQNLQLKSQLIEAQAHSQLVERELAAQVSRAAMAEATSKGVHESCTALQAQMGQLQEQVRLREMSAQQQQHQKPSENRKLLSIEQHRQKQDLELAQVSYIETNLLFSNLLYVANIADAVRLIRNFECTPATPATVRLLHS